MQRALTLGFGAACYAAFFAAFLYLIGWIGGFGVSRTIDSGPTTPLGAALLVNTALLLLFALQHSVMARPRFKVWWTRMVPPPVERSVYVLATVAVLLVLFAAWRPIPAAVWSAESASARAILYGVYGLGVALVLYSTFLIDHFDLFGIRQVVLHFRDTDYHHHRFATPGLYRFVRHPLYVGWITVFWATPTMSVGHFLFALVMTSYILAVIPLEERDLESFHGAPYRQWRDRTPAFVPGTGRAGGVETPREVAEMAAPAAR